MVLSSVSGSKVSVVEIHKVLVHAADVISGIALPIGHMSEEAQEARNKDVRRYRESFTRKFSGEQKMDDLCRRLLVSSDPFISSLKFKMKACGRQNLSSAIRELLNEENPI